MDDAFRLLVSPRARRQMSEQLPLPVAFAAYEFISGPLLSNPRRVGKPLEPPFAGHFSARMGTYRVLYILDEEQCTVEVVAVVARSDAYRSPG